MTTALDRLNSIRETRPATKGHLREWLRAYTGVKVASAPVCREHTPPLEWLSKQWLDRPDQMLILGARGSGKSFLEALLTHMESRFTPRMSTRILGGSLAQSAQIYEAIQAVVLDGHGPGGSDAPAVADLLKTEARYRNGSHVSILAASQKSVRGPHIQTLRLDEVDEIPTDLRDASLGMCMSLRGVRASVSMTSTWHRVGGPMGELVERGRAGEFPCHTTCTFDVLERCSPERSGPYVGGDDLYEKCPECPLKPWCHAERDLNDGRALAKMADGHYAIDSLIQKARAVSARSFLADYLCAGPRPDGVWFQGFDSTRHVSDKGEYDPLLPVHCSTDSGVFCGAVFFQVRSAGGRHLVTVFGEHLAEGWTAEGNAREIMAKRDRWCGSARTKWSTDGAGGSRNPVGPTVLAEYERVGMKPLQKWPGGSVADSLATLEALISPADGGVGLILHPRCGRLVQALQNYRRAKRGGQWQDYPEDPQHPHEDLVDALRGGLKVEFPGGLAPPPVYKRLNHLRVMH